MGCTLACAYLSCMARLAAMVANSSMVAAGVRAPDTSCETVLANAASSGRTVIDHGDAMR